MFSPALDELSVLLDEDEQSELLEGSAPCASTTFMSRSATGGGDETRTGLPADLASMLSSPCTFSKLTTQTCGCTMSSGSGAAKSISTSVASDSLCT
jgi:hypothetical protein